MTDTEITHEKLERSYLRIRCMLGLGKYEWDQEKMIEYTEYALASLKEQCARNAHYADLYYAKLIKERGDPL